MSLSNVAQLSAFRDVSNRKNEGQATRNEELAAEVSLANAKLQEITARKNLQAAWATYNRYLYRPPDIVVDLQEIIGPPSSAARMPRVALAHAPNLFDRRGRVGRHGFDESRLARAAPNFKGLTERAKQSDALANATMATIKPQVSFNASYIDIGSHEVSPIPMSSREPFAYVDAVRRHPDPAPGGSPAGASPFLSEATSGRLRRRRVQVRTRSSTWMSRVSG